MLLGVTDLLGRLSDRPWAGCQVRVLGLRVTLMSSGIATMLLVAVVLVSLIVPACRRRRRIVPSGMANLLELLVSFVRDRIARPLLGGRAGEHLPFLLTLFVFILAMNLMGLVPLEGVAELLGRGHTTPLGVTVTTIPVVCMSLGGIALVQIVLAGLRVAAADYHRRSGRAMGLCLVAAPVLWLMRLGPRVPGATGKLLALPLALLELTGAVIRCAALMIRLLANMVSGHALLAVLMMFILQALETLLREQTFDLLYVAPICIAASVLVNLLELLVAGLQAYIFTFLSAVFLALYAGPEH